MTRVVQPRVIAELSRTRHRVLVHFSARPRPTPASIRESFPMLLHEEIDAGVITVSRTTIGGDCTE
jgi:hypothetical protein